MNKAFQIIELKFLFAASSHCLNMHFLFSLPESESSYLFFIIKCYTLKLYLSVYTDGVLHVNRKSLQGFLWFFSKQRAKNVVISSLINDPAFVIQIN